MTKEEFISRVLDMCIYGGDSIVEKQFFDEFFESNVVIPKGENRHPYADVFHEAMEDTTKVIQFEDGHAGYYWTDLHLAKDRKHRIKPQEPVYEWQWDNNINGF